MSITIYPNPVVDELRIHGFKQEAIEQVLIFNLKGQFMKSVDSFDQKIDLQDLHSGVYLLRVLHQGGNHQQLIVKD